jgi:hypothetical protein
MQAAASEMDSAAAAAAAPGAHGADGADKAAAAVPRPPSRRQSSKRPVSAGGSAAAARYVAEAQQRMSAGGAAAEEAAAAAAAAALAGDGAHRANSGGGCVAGSDVGSGDRRVALLEMQSLVPQRDANGGGDADAALLKAKRMAFEAAAGADAAGVVLQMDDCGQGAAATQRGCACVVM